MTTEHNDNPAHLRISPPEAGVTGRLIRIATALAVAAVAAVAAVTSYRHAYELVSTHGETGATARLIPFRDGTGLACWGPRQHAIARDLGIDRRKSSAPSTTPPDPTPPRHPANPLSSSR